jgi:hypothetical protein
MTSVKQKLYTRMMVRMTEKFGGDSNSLKTIKSTLDHHLGGCTYIEPKVSKTSLVIDI